jgi:cellulose synthase operon protein B
MKKFITLALSIFTLVGMILFSSPLSANVSPVYAQSIAQTSMTATPLPQAGTVPQADSSITFSQLGFNDNTLYGPYDSMSVTFSTPSDWKLEPGAQVQLVLDPSFTPGKNPTTGRSSTISSGKLDISFNGSATFQVGLSWSGENTFTFDIPDTALVPSRQDGRHELQLFLDAGTDCNDYGKTDVLIKPTSKIILPHSNKIPITNLVALPRPFYMKNSFAPTPAVVVIPDKPSASELQAALTVIAGFGRLTTGALQLNLLTINQVTADTLQSSNLIFVGKAAGLPQLQNVKLAAASDGTKFIAKGANPDDGIVQMAVSPWNKANVVLVVGGNSDVALIKAAQATSTGNLRPGVLTNMTLVSDIKQITETGTVAEDRTIAELGYASLTISGMGLQSSNVLSRNGLGSQSSDILFFVPAGQVAKIGSYLKLTFNNSGLLDVARSGFTVYINGETIGSDSLSKDTTNSTTVQINIPPDLVHQGNNILTIEANLVPTDDCSLFAIQNLWATFSSASVLHLPLEPASAVQNTVSDLRYYPYPFISSPSMQTMAFVLPKDDPAAWGTAAKIATYLGGRMQGAMIELGVAFADAIPDNIRQTKDLLVVGRASTLPLITEIAKNLPAPFDPGSDIATEQSLNIVYHLPVGSTIGYLELLQAPWQTQHTILAVMGSNADGLNMAGLALTTPNLRSKLGGDFAAVNGDQVLTSDSRLHVGTGNISATVVPVQSTPQVVTNQNLQPIVVPENHPVWVLPSIMVAAGLIILTLIVLGLVVIFRKKS